MKKILIPISFSEASSRSLQQASQISSQTGAILCLLHCYPSQPFAREHDFGKVDYDQGIRNMMTNFCNTCLGNSKQYKIQLLTYEGGLSEILPDISPQYDLLILSRRPGSELKYNKWFTEKIFYISTRSLCPVLITSSNKKFSFESIRSIWHIKRKEIETALVARKLQQLGLDPQLVISKSLQQETFVSEFWKKIVTYSASHNEAFLKDIEQAFTQETIDLLVVVNHRKGLFESFVKADAFRIISRFNMPILIFQSGLAGNE